MKKNDDLLRLAFGELDDDAARAVEAQASGEGAKELAALRALRAGLQQLPPPPPDNLSAERLRAAILDAELRGRRPAPLSWAWAPLVMAAFAGAVLFARPALLSTSEPQIVSLGDRRSDEARDFPKPNLAFSDSTTPPVAAVSASAAKPMTVAKAAIAEERPVRRRRSARRPRVEEKAVAPAPDDGDEGMRLAMKQDAEPMSIAPPPSAVVPGEPGRGDETVVLVSSKRDLETGAAAATETEASNVLIGG